MPPTVKVERSPMVLVVPTFRWQFAPDWSLGTGRKSLVLERKLDEAWRASLTLAYQQEEARLAVLGCHILLEAGDGPAVIFDIGGGSTELVLLEPGGGEARQPGLGGHEPLQQAIGERQDLGVDEGRAGADARVF